MPTLTLENLSLVLFILVPGFIASRVYALKCPSGSKDTASQASEIICYGLINWVICMPLVAGLLGTSVKDLKAWDDYWRLIIVCLLCPIALAAIWYWLRSSVLHRHARTDHPTPRGWDFFIRSQGEFMVLFHLKNGKMLGGYFGGNSLASTFPQEPEIYVEQIWRVNEIGEFMEPVEGSLGGVVRQSDWERVEFLKVEREGASDGKQEEPRIAETTGRGTSGEGNFGRPSGNGKGAEGTNQGAEGWIGDSAPERTSEVDVCR